MNPETPPSAAKRHEPLGGFALGLLLLFFAQLVVGAFSELAYKPTPDAANASTASLQPILRGFHYWGSSVLIALSFLCLGWMFFAGWWRDGRGKAWIGMVLLMLSALLFQITGNLLPFDKHGVQTAVVESGIARQMPVVGGTAARVMLGGEALGPNTLSLWHNAHLGFSILAIIAAALLLGNLTRRKQDMALIAAPLLISLALALMVRAPLGAAATPDDYSAYGAQVSWYTWPMHGALNLFQRLSTGSGWIGSGLLPGLFVGFLIGLPLLAKRISARAAQAVFACFLGFFGLSAIFFGGSFAPLTGNRDPVIAKADTTPAGEVDPKLFAQGQVLFNSKTCSDCHGKDGKESLGGPILTGIAQRHGVDPAWYMKFIHKPADVKENSTMPAFPGLTQEELRAIAEFLIHSKKG